MQFITAHMQLRHLVQHNSRFTHRLHPRGLELSLCTHGYGDPSGDLHLQMQLQAQEGSAQAEKGAREGHDLLTIIPHAHNSEEEHSAHLQCRISKQIAAPPGAIQVPRLIPDLAFAPMLPLPKWHTNSRTATNSKAGDQHKVGLHKAH
jgi:hypothetical protein